jgi:ribosomal protein L11
MNNITEISIKVPEVTSVPDGNYSGTWGGYIINVKIKDKEYQMKTEKGVRGINIPVVVTVKDGKATFVELNN